MRCLDDHYYVTPPDGTLNGFVVGSWDKGTATRPPRDIDAVFVLPPSVFHRFKAYASNKQSALLQELKAILERTFSRTEISGDGQVVVVDFDDIFVELAPAFLVDGTTGRFLTCDTHDGGSYVESYPWAEADRIDEVDIAASVLVRRMGSTSDERAQVQRTHRRHRRQAEWGCDHHE